MGWLDKLEKLTLVKEEKDKVDLAARKQGVLAQIEKNNLEEDARRALSDEETLVALETFKQAVELYQPALDEAYKVLQEMVERAKSLKILISLSRSDSYTEPFTFYKPKRTERVRYDTIRIDRDLTELVSVTERVGPTSRMTHTVTVSKLLKGATLIFRFRMPGHLVLTYIKSTASNAVNDSTALKCGVVKDSGEVRIDPQALTPTNLENWLGWVAEYGEGKLETK